MESEGSDVTAATRTLEELLLGSLVIAAGIRAGFPFVQFANDVVGVESLLQIDSSIALSPAPELPDGLSPEQRDHLTLMQVDSLEVTGLQCDPDSTLTLRFHDGQSLTVSGTPSDTSVAEPWVVTQSDRSTVRGGAKVVALASSGFAVWERTSDAPDA